MGRLFIGQHDWRTLDSRRKMRSASRLVEVRPQEHRDYAAAVKTQGAFAKRWMSWRRIWNEQREQKMDG
jgi:hypothetical protein